MMNELLHLSLIEGVGPATISKLIPKLKELYLLKQKDLLSCGIKADTAHLIALELSDKKLLDNELELIHKYKVDVVTVLDENYPTLLKQIHLPPMILYSRGIKLKDEPCFSIVGSRKGDSYAKRVCERMIPNLARDFAIVSGGALGVDSMAHEITLENQGRTIAILGSGFLNPYPRENIDLFRTIVNNGGTIISPFPLNMEPLKGNFPARNRIIAGFSVGTLVVQAAIKSGAHITAAFALEQGREVFAVPGSIFEEISLGCHNLIQEGAKLVSSPEDILEEINYV